MAMRVAYANGEALLFGRPMLHTLSSKHPQPVHIFKLWQKFLDNVNPLTKIVHAPTVQLLVLEASTNAHKLLTSTEALMFAIYTSAVNSLTDEECRKIVGESRLVLLCRFSEAAQQALINAEFLRSSNIVVLQAFTLYLVRLLWLA